MITRSGNILPSSYQELDQLFRRFFGDPARHGWRVRMRHRFGYAPGDYWYQAVVDRLVNDGCNWIDVGGGKSIMPFNEPLAAELASRCNLLVGVDPSENLNQNPYVGQRFVGMIEDYRSEPVFDLVTMRMVVESHSQDVRTQNVCCNCLACGSMTGTTTVINGHTLSVHSHLQHVFMSIPLGMLCSSRCFF